MCLWFSHCFQLSCNQLVIKNNPNKRIILRLPFLLTHYTLLYIINLERNPTQDRTLAICFVAMKVCSNNGRAKSSSYYKRVI